MPYSLLKFHIQPIASPPLLSFTTACQKYSVEEVKVTSKLLITSYLSHNEYHVFIELATKQIKIIFDE